MNYNIIYCIFWHCFHFDITPDGGGEGGGSGGGSGGGVCVLYLGSGFRDNRFNPFLH